MRSYKVSVIVPVYNVEKYLEEFIESVVAQTIGFNEQIQLILVNDGSKDGSGEICTRYKDTYGENVIYIDKENGGVSSARNAGLEVATGAYVACIDSDDKLAPDYFERMIGFLEAYKDVPFAAARIQWFGAKDGYHISDFKFAQTRVVDLEVDGNMTHSLVGTSLFRAEAVKDVTFDTSMTHNEDAKFVDTVLLRWKKYCYGVVREALYYYRKRDEETSASDVAKERQSFYDSTLKYAEFLSSAGQYTEDGSLPAFIQFHALYHYRWRITQTKKPDILTDEAWRHYKEVILDGIRMLDASTIIKGSVNLNLTQKMALLHVKYTGDKEKIRQAVNANDELKKKLLDELRFTVNTINYKKADGLVIEGTTSLCDPAVFNMKPKFLLDGKELAYEPIETSVFMFDDTIKDAAAFRIAIANGQQGSFKAQFVSPERVMTLDIAYIMPARISMRQFDYRIIKGKILLLPFKDSLTITDFKLRKIAKREVLLFLQNLLKNKYRIEKNVPKTLAVEVVRLLALLRIRRGPSKVWLFSDRAISGGDNSEVLFRYVADQKDAAVKPVFVINKNTAAYKRLKRDGYKVVKFKSLRHLYLAIISEMMLPSHMDAMYLYPWFGVWQKYCGLLQYDIAHTQHGIVLNDMSHYIGKQKKNASLFLSVSEWEQKHLVEDGYGYTKEQVPVTGLPRYDELIDTSKENRVISLHPTWRSWLSAEAKDGVRPYSNAFKDSEYLKFYQNLINDERLVDALERHNYTLRYYIHPNHMANKRDVNTTSERVEIMDFPYNYSKMFSESSLFVTDYSNTLFDFAYMRKPIVHTQFDFEEFFSKHGSISKQLFDYKTEGFGPVCDDYESAVDAIVNYIENGFTMEDEYKRRVEAFFTYDDLNNSQRAYEAVRSYYLENRP